MTILIDAGHGIDTAGKRSPDGVFREYLFNRQVADLICYELVECGIPVQQVVKETNDISLSTRVQRVNRVCNEEGAGNVLLVSVHANAAGNGTSWMDARGWSCYTSPGQTMSDTAAECLYDAFEHEFPERKIRKDMSDGDRDWEANFTVLTRSKCPAVLLENFFYDNRDECKWLMTDEAKHRIAHATVKGIIKYIDICRKQKQSC